MPQLYVQLEMTAVLFSLLLCGMTVVIGRLTGGGTRKAVMGQFPALVDCLITGVFCILFAFITIAPLLQGNDSHTISDTTTPSLLKGVAGQLLLYIPFVIRYMLQPQQPGKVSFSPLSRVLWVVLGVIAVSLPAFLLDALGVIDAIARLTGSPVDQDVVEGLMNGSVEHRFIIAGAAIIMAPICEEVCFRGFLYNVLKRHGGIVPAAIASGLFFGAIHGALPQLLPLTIFGIIQCYAYEKARSLWLPIAIHCIFNAFGVFFILCSGYAF